MPSRGNKHLSWLSHRPSEGVEDRPRLISVFQDISSGTLSKEWFRYGLQYAAWTFTNYQTRLGESLIKKSPGTRKACILIISVVEQSQMARQGEERCGAWRLAGIGKCRWWDDS